MRWRTVGILAVVAAVSLALAAWAWMSARAPLKVEGVGELLLPSLRRHLEEAARIEIRRGDEMLVVRRARDAWVAGEADFPVHPAQVKSVLLTLAEMKKARPATARAEKYRFIFVDEPNPQSLATRVVVKDKRGRVLADVILGREAPDWLGGGREAQFARVHEEKRAWLVEGRVRAPVRVEGWADNQLVRLPEDSVAEVVIRHGDGEVLRLKPNPEPKKAGDVVGLPLVLEDMPPGAKPNVANIRALFYSLTDLSFNDVRKARPDLKPLAEVRVRTKGGLALVWQVVRDKAGYWLRGTLERAGKDKRLAEKLSKLLPGREFGVYDSVGKVFSSRLEDLIEAEAVDLGGAASSAGSRAGKGGGAGVEGKTGARK